MQKDLEGGRGHMTEEKAKTSSLTRNVLGRGSTDGRSVSWAASR